MFTGIIQAVGTLSSLAHSGDGLRIGVTAPSSFGLEKEAQIGDSIACNGVCLTATQIEGDTFFADVSAESVEHTCFKYYKTGQRLNLEYACTPTTHLGGHIVQGHVDGVGEIVKTYRRAAAIEVWVKAPFALLKYIAPKGSIAVDGISLTVNEISEDAFRLTIIPHTQSEVAFDNWQQGAKVNLEADVLSRYLERLLTMKQQEASGEVTMESLMQSGFI